MTTSEGKIGHSWEPVSRGQFVVFGTTGAVVLATLAWYWNVPAHRGLDDPGPLDGVAAVGQSLQSSAMANFAVRAVTHEVSHDGAVAQATAAAGTETSARSRALLRAQSELASQVDESLDGFLYVNYVLDQVQAFADLPVDPREDVEYDDDELRAFRVLGTPEGTTAHFLVGRESFERDGKPFEYLQFEVEIRKDEKPALWRDALREGPRIHLTVDYDGAGVPGAIAMILTRSVALKESKKEGINAFEGMYTTGAGYWAYFGERTRYHSETYGLVNGQTKNGNKFPLGISPLIGDTQVDEKRVGTLLASLMRSRLAVGSSLQELR